jgi:hypothetical protein
LSAPGATQRDADLARDSRLERRHTKEPPPRESASVHSSSFHFDPSPSMFLHRRPTAFCRSKKRGLDITIRDAPAEPANLPSVLEGVCDTEMELALYCLCDHARGRHSLSIPLLTCAKWQPLQSFSRKNRDTLSTPRRPHRSHLRNAKRSLLRAERTKHLKVLRIVFPERLPSVHFSISSESLYESYPEDQRVTTVQR